MAARSGVPVVAAQLVGSVGCLAARARSRLIIRRGPTLAMIRELLDQSGATAVYWNRQYEPAVISRDSGVKAALHQDGLIAESFNGGLLFEPWTMRNLKGQPYQVFTAFWKACLAQPEPAAARETPTQLEAPRHWPSTLELTDLGLEPTIDWTGGLRATWSPGEAGALEQLNRFLEEALAGYSAGRNRPDRQGTSRLSPHLHFGEISVRRIWFAMHGRRRDGETANSALSDRVYASELGWREFARHLLFHFPHDAGTAAPGGVCRLSLEIRPQGASGVAAWPHRLSHRRRRHA